MSRRTHGSRVAYAVILGLYHFVLGALLIYLVLAIWPASASQEDLGKAFQIFGIQATLTAGQRIVLAVIVLGSAGSFVHSTTSFIGFVGNWTFDYSWAWWYLLRPLIGGTLALGIYLVIRGGLVSVDAGSENLNLYGVAAISFLAGLFSKQAVAKLNEVFSTLFRTQSEEDLGGKLNQIAIQSIEPASLAKGATERKLVITGQGFEKEATVEINGNPRPTNLLNRSQLQATLKAEDVAQAGLLDITVVNPPPRQQRSSPFRFEITDE